MLVTVQGSSVSSLISAASAFELGACLLCVIVAGLMHQQQQQPGVL
jgi:hypothetical protein